MIARVLALALLVGAAGCAAPAALTILPMTEGSLAPFDFSDPGAFAVEASGSELRLASPADYAPPHRSPLAIALVDGVEFRSFVLDAEMQQTGREYGHRDLCLFFGFESAARFYYVHLATTPDANAHNVFLVDRAARRNLLPPQERGVAWGQQEWHHVRLVRDVDAGTVDVYFDDMSAPVLSAQDSTLEWGRIGFGSFDDTGRFRNIVVSSDESRSVERVGSPFAADD